MVPGLPEEHPLHQASSPDHPQSTQQIDGGAALKGEFVFFFPSHFKAKLGMVKHFPESSILLTWSLLPPLWVSYGVTGAYCFTHSSYFTLNKPLCQEAMQKEMFS